MKKIAILLITMLMASVSFAQSGSTAYGFRPVMILPDTATNFPVQAKIGDLVYVQSTHTMYELEVAVGTTKDMNWVLASASRYSYPSVTMSGTTTITGNLSVSGTSTLTGVATVQGQSMTATHDNIMTFGNSVKATDTLFAPVVDATTKLIVGSQIATVPHNNTITFNNSITATDTVFAPTLSVSGNATVSGVLTASVLPTFTIAAGQTTPVGVDTSQVTVSGLTTSAIVLCSYAENITAADTLPSVYRIVSGKVTLRGKANKKIDYWIPKK